jgi:hypothetical protein
MTSTETNADCPQGRRACGPESEEEDIGGQERHERERRQRPDRMREVGARELEGARVRAPPLEGDHGDDQPGEPQPDHRRQQSRMPRKPRTTIAGTRVTVPNAVASASRLRESARPRGVRSQARTKGSRRPLRRLGQAAALRPPATRGRPGRPRQARFPARAPARSGFRRSGSSRRRPGRRCASPAAAAAGSGCGSWRLFWRAIALEPIRSQLPVLLYTRDVGRHHSRPPTG